MAQTLSISESLYNLLRQRAQQADTSPDELAEELLYNSLNEARTGRERIRALMETIHARNAKFTSEEIEADITLAAQEVQEARRANRSHWYQRMGFSLD
jgi:hypothetical protein